jgi:hypothetical protein
MVAVVVGMALADAVPSPCFNDTPRVTCFIDLLLEVDRGNIVKVDLKWILALRPCPTLVASALLYFLFIVATGRRVALIALAVVIPPARLHYGAQMSRAESEWKTLDVPHRVARVHAGSSTAAFVSEDWVGVVELGVLPLR